MKLKKAQRTQRHNLDVAYIQRLLENGEMDGDDAKRILGESLHVIGGLRTEVNQVLTFIDSLKSKSDWLADSQWLK